MVLAIALAVMKGEVVAQTAEGSVPPVPGGISASTLPPTLLQHFQDRGIRPRRETLYGGQKSGEITRRLLDAFKSYQPGRAVTRSDAHR